MNRRRFLALALLLPLAACAPRSTALRVADYSETIRVACIGDSITFGAGVEDRAKNNYPAVLGRLLGDKFQVRNFGVSGATLLKQGDRPYWKLAAFQQATEWNPHAIVIKLGTNDSKPQNWKHKAEFLPDLRAMADHFAALPVQPRLWLCLPVPVVKDRWGINEAVVHGEVIPIIQQVADEKGLPVIDLHTALSGQPALFPDGVHPNAAGARLLARAVYTALMGEEPPQE